MTLRDTAYESQSERWVDGLIGAGGLILAAIVLAFFGGVVAWSVLSLMGSSAVMALPAALAISNIAFGSVGIICAVVFGQLSLPQVRAAYEDDKSILRRRTATIIG